MPPLAAPEHGLAQQCRKADGTAEVFTLIPRWGCLVLVNPHQI
jgi:hypothetical protein